MHHKHKIIASIILFPVLILLVALPTFAIPNNIQAIQTVTNKGFAINGAAYATVMDGEGRFQHTTAPTPTPLENITPIQSGNYYQPGDNTLYFIEVYKVRKKTMKVNVDKSCTAFSHISHTRTKEFYFKTSVKLPTSNNVIFTYNLVITSNDSATLYCSLNKS